MRFWYPREVDSGVEVSLTKNSGPRSEGCIATPVLGDERLIGRRLWVHRVWCHNKMQNVARRARSTVAKDNYRMLYFSVAAIKFNELYWKYHHLDPTAVPLRDRSTSTAMITKMENVRILSVCYVIRRILSPNPIFNFRPPTVCTTICTDKNAWTKLIYARGLTTWCSIPDGGQILLFSKVWTGPVRHTTSCSVVPNVLFPAGKRSGREGDHLPASITKVKNEWNCIPTPHVCLHGMDREYFTLTLTVTWIPAGNPSKVV